MAHPTQTRNATGGEADDRLVGAIVALLDIAKITGMEALSVLRKAGDSVTLSPDDRQSAYERVRLRSIGVEDELRSEEGGGLSDAEFAAALGLGSRETVRNYREKGKIFAWAKDARNFRYPAWQVYQGELLPGLSEMLAIFAQRGRRAALSTANYFLSESEELGGKRPLDLLREGQIEAVEAHARRYGDIGA
jgi:hypothetical protein